MKFFVPHKLKVGDITNLSDKDSRYIIEQKSLREEDAVEIETLNERFLAQVTFVDKASVEVEIIRSLGARELDRSDDLVIMQSISNESKFAILLEKSVELGVDRIIPVESKFSLINQRQFIKRRNHWEKVIREATQQSRNSVPTQLDKVITIKDLEKTLESYNGHLKICLTTENTDSRKLSEIIDNISQDKKILVIIGPERGWDISEIELFRNLKFQFATLGDIILRTETAGIAIASIINFVRKVY